MVGKKLGERWRREDIEKGRAERNVEREERRRERIKMTVTFCVLDVAVSICSSGVVCNDHQTEIGESFPINESIDSVVLLLPPPLPTECFPRLSVPGRVELYGRLFRRFPRCRSNCISGWQQNRTGKVPLGWPKRRFRHSQSIDKAVSDFTKIKDCLVGDKPGRRLGDSGSVYKR